MPVLERFGVSMDDDLLRRFDALSETRGYPSRSEAIRDLVRAELARAQGDSPLADIVGTVTILYDPRTRNIARLLDGLQQEHRPLIVSSYRTLIDAATSMEVIILRGVSEDVWTVANTFINARGVKHGQFVSMATESPARAR